MITKEDILKIAELSRLDLTESEIEKYQKELSEILSFFETLEEVDVTGVEPTAQITGLTNALRQDSVVSFPENIPDSSPLPKADNQVVVPAVFL